MLRKYMLDAEGTTYVKSLLASSSTLQPPALSSLLAHFPLEAGHTFTFAPQSTPKERLTSFHMGGLRHQDEVQEVVSQLIIDYLNTGGTRYLIFEDTVAYSTDPGIEKHRTHILTQGSQLYHFLSRSAQKELVDVTLRKVFYNWLVVGILTSDPTLPQLRHRQEIGQEELRRLVQGTEYIIVNAYDNEGVVVWQKD